MNGLTRRQLVKRAALTAAAAFWAPALRAAPVELPGFHDYPFKLGVASGWPTADAFILWTRLAPSLYDKAAMPRDPIVVKWQVAGDEAFARIVREGEAVAYPENAHAVHVEVTGLEPARPYFYRFIADGEASPVGRSHTLPPMGSPLEAFRFAFASCQSRTDGYYAAYRDMVEQEPQLILHLGDYIYENGWVAMTRRIPVIEAFDLDGYRALYASYKQDEALQAAHAAAPWVTIWDDHEICNDWGGAYSGSSHMVPEAFLARKVAAFKACYEHMPLPMTSRPHEAVARMYGRLAVGNLIQFDFLDCRQYKNDPACQDQPRISDGFASYPKICKAAADPGRSMLGADQEQWLAKGLGFYGATWNAIAQTTMVAPFDFVSGEEAAYDMDGWDSFPVSRQAILDLIAERKLSNTVFLGGNIHAYYSGVLNRVALDPESPPIATEIVGTSISSGGGGDARYTSANSQFSENPFARFFENRRRGYVLCDVTHKAWTNHFRTIKDVADPYSPSSVLARAVIETGKAEVIME